MDIVTILRAESAKWETLYAEAMEQLRERSAELEESQSERMEQARLLGMSGERELALRAELERERAKVMALESDLEKAENTINDLAP